MKIKLIIFISILFIINGCKNSITKNSTFINKKTDVKIVKPIVKNLKIYDAFQAVSKYLNTSAIKSPISGVIQMVNISVGQEVYKNELLFKIKPKELAALENAKLDKSLINISSIKIRAHQLNFITAVNFQVGDYVQEGDVLAKNVKKNSMVIIAYVPFNIKIKLNSLCKIELPNGAKIKGVFERKLTQTDLFNQKQPYVVYPLTKQFFAENINLTIQKLNREIKTGLFVPKKAVYANEEQTKFWVMKMINDTTAIKKYVTIGFQNDSIIQLLNTPLSKLSKIVLDGGYGLADTAFVHVTTPKKLQ